MTLVFTCYFAFFEFLSLPTATGSLAKPFSAEFQYIKTGKVHQASAGLESYKKELRLYLGVNRLKAEMLDWLVVYETKPSGV